MARTGFSLLVLALGLLVSDAAGQKVCGFYEEGKAAAVTCTTKTFPFSRFGPRVGVKDVFEEKSYCDSEGQCVDTNNTRYQATYSHDLVTGHRNVTLRISQISREMTMAKCYIDGNALLGVECALAVYIRPSKPICSNIEFVDGNQSVEVSCTSDRVYPHAICGLKIVTSEGNFEEDHRLTVTDSLANSTQYPGDKELTCVFKKYLPGIAEDRYTFIVRFYSPIPDHTPTAISANSIPTLELRATTLEYANPATYDPVTQGFEIDIYVISNPPPYDFSLSVRFDETSAFTSVSNLYYSAVYIGQRGEDDLKGTIRLTVKPQAFINNKRTGFFTFTASNRVVKPIPFQATFTITRYNIAPTPATCESPVFVEEGAAAVITCTSDRLYPAGQCQFKNLTNTLLREEATIKTTNFDSTVYPRDKRVTCELRLPVAGSSAGQHQFLVDITPSMNPTNLSTSVTTPSITLTSTQHAENTDGLIFTYPDSGDLLIDVRVTGNPAPNRVTLSVMQSGGSRQQVPVSSQDFLWSYAQTPGYQAGTVQLSLSRALKTVAVKSYTLKVENGVVGGTEFQYTFMVGQIVLPTQPVCEDPLFVEGGAKAVVTCTSDRISPPWTCEFNPTNKSAKTESASEVHNAEDQESTTYDGYKKATCALHVPVTGNRDGDYQFQVEFTSTDFLSKSQPTLTPVISLKATVLYNPSDNNHTFKNKDSGELGVDVHVTGIPAPTRVTVRMRQDENSKSVPVSSRDFRWSYERTVGFEAGVVQLTIASVESGGLCWYTVTIENGVVADSAVEYRFSVDYGTPAIPTADESKSSDNVLPVAIGAGAGALLLIIVIIVVVVVVIGRRKRTPSDPSPDYDYPKTDFDPPIPNVYPNFAFSPDTVSPYADASCPYLRPISERPYSQYSLPEYSEIEDQPNQNPN